MTNKLTEKQLAARRENLRKGREKRMENLKGKKDEKPQYEYDLGSHDADSEDSSSDDEFVISKKKVVSKKNGPKPRTREEVEYPPSKNEIEELKNMVLELAIMQKKNNKSLKKQQGKPSKVLLIPPTTQQQATQPKQLNDTMIDHLRKSLGM